MTFLHTIRGFGTNSKREISASRRVERWCGSPRCDGSRTTVRGTASHSCRRRCCQPSEHACGEPVEQPRRRCGSAATRSVNRRSSSPRNCVRSPGRAPPAVSAGSQSSMGHALEPCAATIRRWEIPTTFAPPDEHLPRADAGEAHHSSQLRVDRPHRGGPSPRRRCRAAPPPTPRPATRRRAWTSASHRGSSTGTTTSIHTTRRDRGAPLPRRCAADRPPARAPGPRRRRRRRRVARCPTRSPARSRPCAQRSRHRQEVELVELRGRAADERSRCPRAARVGPGSRGARVARHAVRPPSPARRGWSASTRTAGC